MDIQVLRNLTTGRLHTDISKVYEALEQVTGLRGLMTHQLPGVMRKVKPYLMQCLPPDQYPRLWDDRYDTTHTGDIPVSVMPAEEFSVVFGFER